MCQVKFVKLANLVVQPLDLLRRVGAFCKKELQRQRSFPAPSVIVQKEPRCPLQP